MGDFDDINIKIAVDAAGAESGLNSFSSAIDKVSENIAGLGEGIDFSDAITREVLAATNDIKNLDALIQGVIEGISAESIDIAVGVDAEGAADYLAEIDESIKQTIENAEYLQEAIDAALGSATGQAFAIDLDISEAQETLADLGSAIDAAAASGFIIPADVDISQAESAIDELSETMANIPAGMDLSGTVDSLAGVDSALQETTENAESLGDALGAPMSEPFIVTAGDITDALDSIITKIQGAESSIAGFNKVSAGIEQISGISADAAKQLAISISDEDMSIQGALESEKILGKQRVDSITQMESLLSAWKDFANANDEQAASLQEKLIPAWNQFGISAEEQPKYMDVLTTLFQETTLSPSDFSGSILKTGKSLSDMGLSLDQVAKLYLTMEESGLVGKKGMSALSGVITDINKEFTETGKVIPAGDKALSEIITRLGVAPDKVNAANEAFNKSAGAVDRWSEAMDKGDTSSEKLGAQIAKATAGFEEMLVPLAPAATGVAALAGVCTELAVFDAFLGGGRLKGGLDAIITKLPLIGTAAAGATPEIAGATGALSLLGGPVTVGLLAAAGVAVAAYATNFGGFADNINDSISKAQLAVEAFGKGNYEEAGKQAALSISEGFEALGDLLKDIISNLPELTVDAAKLLKGIGDGLKKFAYGVGEGFGIALQKTINSASIELSGLWNTIQNYWNSIQWSDLGGSAIDAISKAMSFNVEGLSGMFASIEDAWKNGINWSKLGYDAAQAIVDGFKLINPIVGSGVQGLLDRLTGKPSPTDEKKFTAAITTTGPTYTAIPVTSTDTSKWKYGGPGYTAPGVSAPGVSATGISESEFKKLEDAQIKIWLEGMGKYGESVDKYRTIFEKENADWVTKTKEASGATGDLADKTKKTELPNFASVDEAMKAGVDSFTVGTQEYKRVLDESGKIISEEQGLEAESKRKQSEVAQANEEKRQKEQDAITKEQSDAAKKVTEKQKQYANRIEQAAFDYQQTVKYGTSADQLNSALTTYKKQLEKISFDAGQEGVSLEGLNTSLQIGSETANNLKTTYTNINADLKKQISELEAEKQKKISGAKAGTEVDTSAIDKKIDDLNKKIKENDAAISSATATVQKNTVAVKSSMGGQTASIEALRKKYAEVSKIAPDIIAQLNFEDLVRNLALYGVQIGDINQELGGTVQQLDAISSSVQDISSTEAFTRIQNKFADLKKQFDDGTISQDKYLEELRKTSAETDTLSRSTNILKGDQKEAVLEFERNIKESLRRIEAGYGYKTEEQVAAIGASITRFGGISTPSAGIPVTVANIDKLDDAYKEQGISAGKAAALQFAFNDAISDGNVKLSEAYHYLANYNTVTGQNAEITQKTASDALDMMNAMQQANKLQQLYTDAMKDGTITGDELKGIQSQQTIVQDALTTSSSNAKDAAGHLPPALQAVADTVNSVISQIYAQLQAAQSAAAKTIEVANTQASRFTPGGELTGPQVSNTVNISNNQFGQTTTPEDVARKAVMSFGAAF